MAIYLRIFYAIDKDNTGVITSVDLRNYMQKMRYKESFVTTWTSLFDPEHTGIITYENYCKVLGLKQENRTPPPPLSETQSNSHAIETQITPTNSEPVRAEHTLHKPEERNSENSGSQCQRTTDSVSKEDSSLKHHKAQEPSNELTSSVEATEELREVSGKVSRKRKHAKSPSKENVITPIISKSNVEAHSPKNSGMETKSEPMNLAADSQAMESITPQKVDQILSAKSSLNSKVDGSGKLKKREKEGSHKTLKESSQESPDVESKGADSKEGNSGEVVEGQEKCKESKRKGKPRSPEIKGKELCDGKGEHPGDSGMDIFDFLIAAKSDLIGMNDECSDEEPSKSTNEELAPEMMFRSESRTKLETQNASKPMEVVLEKHNEVQEKEDQKPNENAVMEPSVEKGEHPGDSGMDIFDFLIAAKSDLIGMNDECSDEEPSKSTNEELAPEMMFRSESRTKLETQNASKPMEVVLEKHNEVQEKEDQKPKKNTKMESSDEIGEQSDESGMDIFDFLISGKDGLIEAFDDFDDQPQDKMVSETADLTVTGNPALFHETEKDKPHQRSKNGFKNVSEKSEHIASNAPEDISASSKEQLESGEDTFDMLLEDIRCISEEQNKDFKHMRRKSESSIFEEA
ncbi:unnamed protein product [Rodentolepis nana]|uniref:EF-hand domain-containing protein n=1 Tax=Rodentolepis nana TaxID=102285 RepID=A0A0R3TNF1_RODNA|nr:unnamed protein product [Rodentolepis nana]